jgi:hypothetical protein
MKIFIQGRKDGYNTLYPKPTPADFFKFAADIQRIDAQRDAKYYGKSLYSIAFNGTGCIFTKYIIGYDTLRSNIGNIGISILIAANQKILGADIKNLLDELINIYTSNYCPDFKINNQKQEDWLLFSSAANNYDSKVKTISADENFQYGNKDAAHVFYNNVAEIEKYLENPYQEEYKEHKQIFFIEKQSQLILEVIKYDQTANLTGKIDLESPTYKLKEYYGEGKNGVSIEIRANGKLRNNKDKIFGKDNVSIKYSKKYYYDIFVEGKLSEPQIEKYLKIYDSSIDVEKNPEITPTKKTVEIIINDSKGNLIPNAIIACKNNYSKSEKQVYQNTINFSGEEQKDRWTISAKKDLFTGEDTFTPEHTSIVKLTLKEVKIIKLQILDEKRSIIKSYDLHFYDDDIRKEHTEPINISGYHSKKETFTPNKKFDAIIIQLQKQVIQQPKPQDPKVGPTGDGRKILNLQMPGKIKILLGSTIACLLIVGVYFLAVTLWNIFHKPEKPKDVINTGGVIKIDTTEIIGYVEGDTLFLDKLKNYKEIWEKQNKNSANYKKIVSDIDRAIKKRKAINNGDFALLKDSCRYSKAQMDFKKAVDAVEKLHDCSDIKKLEYEKVKKGLGDVPKLTLKQITDNINKILTEMKAPAGPVNPVGPATPEKTVTPKNENQNSANQTKTDNNKGDKTNTAIDSTKIIIDYLKGNELKGDKLRACLRYSKITNELKKSIGLALDFWNLDGKNTNYNAYKSKVKNDKHLQNNSTLKLFIETAGDSTKYPNGISGAGTTKTLSKFIEEAK